MNTQFDRIDFIHKLEGSGLARNQAEAISWGMTELSSRHVTQEQLRLALAESENRLTARFGMIVGASTMTLMVAVIAALISLAS